VQLPFYTSGGTEKTFEVGVPSHIRHELALCRIPRSSVVAVGMERRRQEWNTGLDYRSHDLGTPRSGVQVPSAEALLLLN
jgi:hypothetical protein